MNIERVEEYIVIALIAADVIFNIIRSVNNRKKHTQLEEKIQDLKLQMEKIEHHAKSRE